MANLLKVVLVADNAVLPPDSTDVKFIFVKDIICTRGGYADLEIKHASTPHIAIPLPDQSVAVWQFNQSLETLPNNISLTELFTEVARVCVNNARLVIEARHPAHDNFIDDDCCVRSITVNKLATVMEQTKNIGSWRTFLTQLVIDPEFLPVIKDLTPKQRDFELRTRRNAIKHSRLGVMVKNQNTSPNFITCYTNIPSVKPFAFTVYSDWKQDQYLSPEIVMTGQWEPQETNLVLSIMRGLQRQWGVSEAERPLKFFNVGGNIGWYSALVLNANEHAQIEAFEPINSNFELLERNTAPNVARAHLHKFALSNEPGETTFYIDNGNLGGCSMVERPEGYLVKETVKLHTFDEIYADADASSLCDLMVMDIEGAEHKFFDGAHNLFERGFRPIMMLEYYPTLLKLQGSDGSYVRDLAHWGYRFYNIDRRNGTVGEVKADSFLQHYARLVGSESFLNYLAVPAHYDLAALLNQGKV